MSNRNRKKVRGQQERRFSVRAVRRDPPDVKKLGQALIALAMADAEKAAQEQHKKEQKRERKSGGAA